MTDSSHHRHSIRLCGYDYASVGAYFVTICAHDRACLFGTIADGAMFLNDAGRMARDEWQSLPSRFSTVAIDEFVIMPNHMHGIIVLIASGDRATTHGATTHGATINGATINGATINGATINGATTRVAPTNSPPPGMLTVGAPLVGAHVCAPSVGGPSVGAIVGAYKSITTNRYIHGVHQFGWPRFNGRLWQRNYYEHIVRYDDDMNRIREYISTNPARWEIDKERDDAGF